MEAGELLRALCERERMVCFKLNRVTVAAAVLTMLAPASSFPQSASPRSDNAKPAAQKPAPKKDTKRRLVDMTRVSTEATVKQIQLHPVTATAPGAKDAKPMASFGVTELEPVAGNLEASGDKAGASSKSPKKAALKDVHGNLYGALGPEGHEAGGAAGATSQGGKTSVYVQTEHAQEPAPR